MVEFYEDDSAVIENVAYLAEKSLREGSSTVLIATPEHRARIHERLLRSGLDLEAAREAGQYVTLDAAATMAQFTVAGQIDQANCEATIGRVLQDAIRASAIGFVFAFGEMVALLCAANQHASAIQLEQIWNALAERHHFSLCCAYPLSSLGTDPDLDVLFRICAEHALAIPAESLL
jgi:MEDS: MEthanogen/methylotroph, DcmR Sensory domain